MRRILTKSFDWWSSKDGIGVYAPVGLIEDNLFVEVVAVLDSSQFMLQEIEGST